MASTELSPVVPWFPACRRRLWACRRAGTRVGRLATVTGSGALAQQHPRVGQSVINWGNGQPLSKSGASNHCAGVQRDKLGRETAVEHLE